MDADLSRGAGALWPGFSHVSFRRVLHTMHRTGADRPVWRTALRIVAATLVAVSLLLTTALALSLTGRLARRLGGALRLGPGPQAARDALRWLGLATVAIALVPVLVRLWLSNVAIADAVERLAHLWCSERGRRRGALAGRGCGCRACRG
ncbi:hypothetical protein [Streptomyces sp. NPDC007856]|uniref:hypothetical protein n=1 Tax=Streptomyces sp. NPDC007856 TaxID=3364781 RepID=UPI00369DC554